MPLSAHQRGIDQTIRQIGYEKRHKRCQPNAPCATIQGPRQERSASDQERHLPPQAPPMPDIMQAIQRRKIQADEQKSRVWRGIRAKSSYDQIRRHYRAKVQENESGPGGPYSQPTPQLFSVCHHIVFVFHQMSIPPI